MPLTEPPNVSDCECDGIQWVQKEVHRFFLRVGFFSYNLLFFTILFFFFVPTLPQQKPRTGIKDRFNARWRSKRRENQKKKTRCLKRYLGAFPIFCSIVFFSLNHFSWEYFRFFSVLPHPASRVNEGEYPSFFAHQMHFSGHFLVILCTDLSRFGFDLSATAYKLDGVLNFIAHGSSWTWWMERPEKVKEKKKN